MSQAGFISQSLSQLSLGFCQAIQRCQRYTEVQMWPWGRMFLQAIELDSLVVVLNGFPRLAEIVVAKAEIFIRAHHPRIKRNDLMEFSDRLRVVLGVIIQSSEPIDIAVVLWGTIYEFFEFTPRPIAPAQSHPPFPRKSPNSDIGHPRKTDGQPRYRSSPPAVK